MANNKSKNRVEKEKNEILALTEKLKEGNSFTKEEEKKLNFRLFINLMLAVLIMVYFCLINLGYRNIAKDTFILDLHVFSFTILIASIVLFELSYRKDNGKLCVYGIEMLFLAIVTLLMPYIFFYSNQIVKTLCSSLSIYLSIYYVGKCMLIQRKARKEHLEKICDVKEIVKK